MSAPLYSVAPAGRTVAIAGTASALPDRLAERLSLLPDVRDVVSIDLRGFIESETAAQLPALLKDHGVDTVIHAGLLGAPHKSPARGHELEAIGTVQLLGACAAAAVGAVIAWSQTLVYGAHPRNPNYLREDHPLRDPADAPFLRDKIGAEQELSRFAGRHPETCVTILRTAPMLGPTVAGESLVGQLLSRPACPVLMGHDPLVQLVHESDVVEAFAQAVLRRAPGTFNIVGDGVLPYRSVLAHLGRVPVPLPAPIVYPVWQLLWSSGVVAYEPALLDFLRYLCVADGGKARAVLGWRPRHDIHQILAEFVGLAEDVQPAQEAAR